MVEHGWIDEAAFETFVFTNPARFYTGTNPALLRGHRGRVGRRPAAGRGADVLDLMLTGRHAWSTGPGPGRGWPTSVCATAGSWPSATIARGGGPGDRRRPDGWCAPGSSTSTPTTTPSCCGTRRPARRSLHGVTTVIGGNCGFSIAPLGPGDAEYVQRDDGGGRGDAPSRRSRAAARGTWRTFAEYLDRLDVGLAVNAGFLVGHSTVRRVVMGEAATDGPRPTPDSSRPWSRLVGESLAGGALGFSSSLGEGHLDGDDRPVPSSSCRLRRVRRPGRRAAGPSGHHARVHPAIGPIPEERVRADGRHVAGRRPTPQLEPARQPGLARRSTRSSCEASDRGRGAGAPTWSPWPCPT